MATEAQQLAQPLTWTHPTGGAPESVLIVALGPSKSDLLEVTTSHEPPEVIMEADEVWGLNAGVNHLAGRVAWDMLWVMDHLDGEVRRLPRYGDHMNAWLRRFGRPLMTSRMGQFGASAVLKGANVREYPLQWVLDQFPEHPPYFHNSVPYLIAYAVAIGVKRLSVWGADYSHEASKRREEDRANAEYWVGIARERGVEFSFPSSTTLCNVSRGLWFYGYGEQPEVHCA